LCHVSVAGRLGWCPGGLGVAAPTTVTPATAPTTPTTGALACSLIRLTRFGRRLRADLCILRLVHGSFANVWQILVFGVCASRLLFAATAAAATTTSPPPPSALPAAAMLVASARLLKRARPFAHGFGRLVDLDHA
jgi:hypothetical protein